MFKQTLLALSLAAASTAALALPNIAVLATGGTIAGAGASSTGCAISRLWCRGCRWTRRGWTCRARNG